MPKRQLVHDLTKVPSAILGTTPPIALTLYLHTQKRQTAAISKARPYIAYTVHDGRRTDPQTVLGSCRSLAHGDRGDFHEMYSIGGVIGRVHVMVATTTKVRSHHSVVDRAPSAHRCWALAVCVLIGSGATKPEVGSTADAARNKHSPDTFPILEMIRVRRACFPNRRVCSVGDNVVRSRHDGTRKERGIVVCEWGRLNHCSKPDCCGTEQTGWKSKILHDTVVCFYICICTAIFGGEATYCQKMLYMAYLEGQAKDYRTLFTCSGGCVFSRTRYVQPIPDGTAPPPCLRRQRQQEVKHLGPVLLPPAAAATAPAGVPPNASSAGISSPP